MFGLRFSRSSSLVGEVGMVVCVSAAQKERESYGEREERKRQKDKKRN